MMLLLSDWAKQKSHLLREVVGSSYASLLEIRISPLIYFTLLIYSQCF